MRSLTYITTIANRDVIRTIHRLTRTAHEACKAIEEQTGWKATMLLGGPNPETGRMVSLTCVFIYRSW